MKNIKKSKKWRYEQKKRKNEKIKGKKDKKNGRKQVGKKGNECPKGGTRDGPKNWFFT